MGMFPASIPKVNAANTTTRLASSGMPANRIDSANTRNAASWLAMDVQVSHNHRVRATSIVCWRMSTSAAPASDRALVERPEHPGGRLVRAAAERLATCSFHSTRPMTTPATRQTASPTAAATTS